MKISHFLNQESDLSFCLFFDTNALDFIFHQKVLAIFIAMN